MVQRKRFAITIATSIGFALLSALVVMLKPASATFIQNQQPPQESSTAAEYQSLSSPQTVTVTTLFVENSSPTPLGETTTFTAVISATLPITYQWDFGNGNTSTAANPSTTYTASGAFTASMEPASASELAADMAALLILASAR